MRVAILFTLFALILGGCSMKLEQTKLNNKNSLINKNETINIVALDQQPSTSELANKITEYSTNNGYRLSSQNYTIQIGVATLTDEAIKAEGFVSVKYKYAYDKNECPYYSDSYEAQGGFYGNIHNPIRYRSKPHAKPHDRPEPYNPLKPRCTVTEVDMSKCLDIVYDYSAALTVSAKSVATFTPSHIEEFKYCNTLGSIDRAIYTNAARQKTVDEVAKQSVKLIFPYYSRVDVKLFEDIESIKVEKEIKERFDAALKMIEEKNYSKAIANLEEIYFQMNDYTPKEVCFNLAALYEHLGMNKKALYFYSKKLDDIFMEGYSRVMDKM